MGQIKYLVVYEDEWGCKQSFKTTTPNDTIKEIVRQNDLRCDRDLDGDLSVPGTFSIVFPDIDLWDTDQEPRGRIMIFDISEPVWTTKDGRQIPINEMTTGHLRKTISLLKRRKSGNGWIPILEGELKRR